MNDDISEKNERYSMYDRVKTGCLFLITASLLGIISWPIAQEIPRLFEGTLLITLISCALTGGLVFLYRPLFTRLKTWQLGMGLLSFIMLPSIIPQVIPFMGWLILACLCSILVIFVLCLTSYFNLNIQCVRPVWLQALLCIVSIGVVAISGLLEKFIGQLNANPTPLGIFHTMIFAGYLLVLVILILFAVSGFYILMHSLKCMFTEVSG